jgi:hypothetical protein
MFVKYWHFSRYFTNAVSLHPHCAKIVLIHFQIRDEEIEVQRVRNLARVTEDN